MSVLNPTEDATADVRAYFESQAPDLTITFMQKVYSESVLQHRHDVWDIHTDKDRWWVITNPTNLYSQEQFPNMDLVVTFHIGLCLRIPRSQRQQVDDRRVLPFGEVFAKLEEATDAVSQAHNVADYQAVGVRCRETLLAFIAIAQDSAVWTDTPPKRADYKAWTDFICNDLLAGDSNKERRHLMKGALDSAMIFANWLTHSKSVVWQDAEMAVAAAEYAISMATSMIVRELRGVPDACPECGSPKLEPEDGVNSAAPNVLWQRPRCNDCGWVGDPVPIAETDDNASLITREGDGAGDEHIFMTTPLRSIKKPSRD